MLSGFDPSVTELVAYAGTKDAPTVVLGGMTAPDESWLKKVAGEFESETLFVWRDGDSHRVTAAEALNGAIESSVLECVVALLGREGRARVGDSIRVQTDAQSFECTVQSSDAALGERELLLTGADLDAWMLSENRAVIQDITLSLRSQTGVIPFVGAGASATFGYPMWGEFLEGCGARHRPPRCGRAREERQVRRGRAALGR